MEMTTVSSPDEIVIEKGVLPPSRSKTGLTAAMRQLQVGDSFVLPAHMPRSATYSIARLLGIRISARRVDGSLRIWRIA